MCLLEHWTPIDSQYESARADACLLDRSNTVFRWVFHLFFRQYYAQKIATCVFIVYYSEMKNCDSVFMLKFNFKSVFSSKIHSNVWVVMFPLRVVTGSLEVSGKQNHFYQSLYLKSTDTRTGFIFESSLNFEWTTSI